MKTRFTTVILILTLCTLTVGCSGRQAANESNRVLKVSHDAILAAVRTNETAFEGDLIDASEHHFNELKILSFVKRYNAAHEAANEELISQIIDQLNVFRLSIVGR